MSFVHKWIETKIILLSEVIQVQKDKGRFFPHILEMEPIDKNICNYKHLYIDLVCNSGTI
jgi:hypothetical protein